MFHSSERNCNMTVRLVWLFLSFLHHKSILSEIRGLQDALAITRLAVEELPLIVQIGKLLPDTFHAGCRECWGSKCERYTMSCGEVAPIDSGPTKKRKWPDVLQEGVSHSVNAMDWPGSKTFTAAQKKRLRYDVGGITEAGWTTDATEICNPGWAEDAGTALAVDTSIWLRQRHSLLTLLGPTALPITHCTGVVESSTRRITSILPPTRSFQPTSHRSDYCGPNPEAVELNLAERFVKVILMPWIGGNNIPQPRILPTSQSVGGVARPHDPISDDITVLVEPGMLANLKTGMYIGAIWVQLIRQVGGDQEMGTDKESRKGKKRLEPTYWYIDQLSNILPSYYLD
jgi:hypothetical protein